jgi:heme exporter protein B
MMLRNFWQATLTIARKDLRAEIRSRELVNTMGLFALLSVLIFSFALELDRLARQEAVSGVLWVTLVFASILGLNRSLAMEREQGSFDALLMAPISRGAIFAGKLLANFSFTLIVGLIMLPLMTLLYNMPVIQPWIVVLLLLGTAGFSTVGTLLAAMTVQTRARESLLPIVMLPMALPVLIAAVRASTALLNDAPLEDWIAWPQIMAVVDLIYLTLCFLLFEYVIEG